MLQIKGATWATFCMPPNLNLHVLQSYDVEAKNQLLVSINIIHHLDLITKAIHMENVLLSYKLKNIRLSKGSSFKFANTDHTSLLIAQNYHSTCSNYSTTKLTHLVL